MVQQSSAGHCIWGKTEIQLPFLFLFFLTYVTKKAMPNFLRTAGYTVFELQLNVNPHNTMILFFSMTFAASL